MKIDTFIKKLIIYGFHHILKKNLLKRLENYEEKKQRISEMNKTDEIGKYMRMIEGYVHKIFK